MSLEQDLAKLDSDLLAVRNDCNQALEEKGGPSIQTLNEVPQGIRSLETASGFNLIGSVKTETEEQFIAVQGDKEYDELIVFVICPEKGVNFGGASYLRPVMTNGVKSLEDYPILGDRRIYHFLGITADRISYKGTNLWEDGLKKEFNFGTLQGIRLGYMNGEKYKGFSLFVYSDTFPRGVELTVWGR